MPDETDSAATETGGTGTGATSTDAKPVAVPRQVHCELETLRQMGTHDVFSTEVIEGLEAYDFDAALAWVLEHPEKYEHAVRRGMKVERATGDS